MIELKKIQEAIQNYIQQGDLGALSYVHDDPVFSSERLQLYRNAYFLRLIEVLKADYPKLHQHLGAVAFGTLVYQYLAITPSTHYSLREIGRHLPSVMAHDLKCDRDALALATVEGFCHEVLRDAHEAVLSLSRLRGLSLEEQMTSRFQLIRAHRLVVLDSPIVEHYFNLDAKNGHLLIIWNKQHKVCYQVLSEKDAYLIAYCREGLDFMSLCEKMSQYLLEEEGVSFIFQRIQYWLNQEIFIDL